MSPRPRLLICPERCIPMRGDFSSVKVLIILGFLFTFAGEIDYCEVNRS